MALTPRDIQAIRAAFQPDFDRIDDQLRMADENARKYRDEILTAVDAYKVLVERFQSEVTALRAKYARLELVLKRVAEKTGVEAPEL